MQPIDNLISKFQIAWKEEFGEEISKETAREELENIADLLRIILKPIPPGTNNNNKQNQR
jgi:hypothetical protein